MPPAAGERYRAHDANRDIGTRLDEGQTMIARLGYDRAWAGSQGRAPSVKTPPFAWPPRGKPRASWLRPLRGSGPFKSQEERAATGMDRLRFRDCAAATHPHALRPALGVTNRCGQVRIYRAEWRREIGVGGGRRGGFLNRRVCLCSKRGRLAAHRLPGSTHGLASFCVSVKNCAGRNAPTCATTGLIRGNKSSLGQNLYCTLP